jgi:hypothetical protein
MSITCSRNNNWEREVQEEILVQGDFPHHKTHMDYPGYDPGIRDQQQTTNRFTVSLL